MATVTGQKQFNSLEDLLLEQLSDIMDAEKQVLESLPKMEEAAANKQLKRAFHRHLGQTEKQIKRLEKIFKKMDHEPEAERCAGMAGLLEEGDKIASAQGNEDVRDAGLIAAAQRVEHYEVASYGCARAYAEQLGLDAIAKLLQQTLDEEGKTDKILTDLAEKKVNVKAEESEAAQVEEGEEVGEKEEE